MKESAEGRCVHNVQTAQTRFAVVNKMFVWRSTMATCPLQL